MSSVLILVLIFSIYFIDIHRFASLHFICADKCCRLDECKAFIFSLANHSCFHFISIDFVNIRGSGGWKPKFVFGTCKIKEECSLRLLHQLPQGQLLSKDADQKKGTCPQRFIKDSQNLGCWMYQRKEATHFVAERICKHHIRNGHLAVLDTKHKHMALRKWLDNVDLLDMHVGAVRARVGRNFTWNTGVKVGSKGWCPSLPSSARRPCLTLRAEEYFCFDYKPCTEELSFLCEAPIKYD